MTKPQLRCGHMEFEGDMMLSVIITKLSRQHIEILFTEVEGFQ